MDDSICWYKIYLSVLIVPSQMSKLGVWWMPTQPHSITDNGVLAESEVFLNPENMASMVPKSYKVDASQCNTHVCTVTLFKLCLPTVVLKCVPDPSSNITQTTLVYNVLPSVALVLKVSGIIAVWVLEWCIGLFFHSVFHKVRLQDDSSIEGVLVVFPLVPEITTRRFHGVCLKTYRLMVPPSFLWRHQKVGICGFWWWILQNIGEDEFWPLVQ